MAPADQGFGVRVQTVIEPVFRREKMRGQRWDFAGMGTAGVDQCSYIAAGTKRFRAIAAQQYTNDLRVIGPFFKTIHQRLDHRQRQRIQRLFRIQAGNTNARAVLGVEFFKLQIHHDLSGGGATVHWVCDTPMRG